MSDSCVLTTNERMMRHSTSESTENRMVCTFKNAMTSELLILILAEGAFRLYTFLVKVGIEEEGLVTWTDIPHDD